MGEHLNPGPPLVAEPEFCPTAAPSGAEYTRATLAGLVMAPAGAGIWFLTALATERAWGFVLVMVGAAAGYGLYRAAGLHRSAILGAMAGTVTLLAAAGGYGLLWLPFVKPAVREEVSWLHLGMAGLGIFIAFILAGPRPEPAHQD